MMEFPITSMLTKRQCKELLNELAGLATGAGIDLPGLNAALETISRAESIEWEMFAWESSYDRFYRDQIVRNVAVDLINGELSNLASAADKLTVELAKAIDVDGALAEAVQHVKMAAPHRAASKFFWELDGGAVFNACESVSDSRHSDHAQRLMALLRELGVTENSDWRRCSDWRR